MNFSRRNASRKDTGFIYSTKKDCLHDYVESVWGWDEELQWNRFNDNLNLENTEILIDSEGRPIGVLEIVEEHRKIDLVNFEIVQSNRNIGIGSAVINELKKSARANGKLITLRVFKSNAGAIRFYRRHGFSESGQSEYHFNLMFDPDRVP